MTPNAKPKKTVKPARTTQERVDATPESHAWEEYKTNAADHACKAQRWKDSKVFLGECLDDLIRVHAHKPLDEGAVEHVAKATALAAKGTMLALDAKQASKKYLDACWRNVLNHGGPLEPPGHLIADAE